jgi:hypothetical protein
MKPKRCLKIVFFREPFGPWMARFSPGATSNETSASATVEP